MTRLKIEGMSCQHCVKAVTAALSDVAGVSGVEVDLEKGTAVVQGSADLAALQAAVEEEGFTARVQE